MYNKLFKKISLSLIAMVLFFTTVPMTASALEDNKETNVNEEIIEDTQTEDEDGSNQEEIENPEDLDSVKETISPRDVEADVIVDMEHNKTYRTYTNHYTNNGLELFDLTVNFSVNTPNLEGVKIEIPLDGYVVKSSKENFKHFTTEGAIFSLEPFTAPDPSTSMFKSVVYDSTSNKIVVELNKTVAGVQNLNFEFKFNEAFDSIIPGSQVIWEDIHANVFLPGATSPIKYASGDLTSTTNDSYKIDSKYYTPSTDQYVDGEITMRSERFSYAFDFHKTDFDNFENKFYVEVPVNTQITYILDIVDLSKPYTTTEDPAVKVGHVRYYGTFESDEEIAQVPPNNAPWNLYSRTDVKIIPDATSLQIGDSFEVKTGIIFKKINAEPEEVSHTISYVKAEKAKWALDGNGYNNTGSSNNHSIIVDLDNQNAASRMGTIFGWLSYGDANTVKNEGSEPITGVRYEMYNNMEGSERLNYRDLQVIAMSKDASVAIPSYELEYKINKENSTDVRYINSGLIKANPEKRHVTPVLNEGEYISIVTLIPVKENGEGRNELQPKTAFSIRYRMKNWPENKWPDGTAIPMDRLTNVPLTGTMFFNDEDGAPATLEMPEKIINMGRNKTVDASIAIVSSNAKQRDPLGIVDYNIQVSVGSQSLGNYTQPEITVAIPKQLELVDAGTPKDFVDLINNVTHTDGVEIKPLASDSKYNYYKFISDHTGYISGGVPSFRIPIQVRVVEGTLAGEYKFGGMTLSRFGGDFIQLVKAVNNTTENNAKKYGHTNTDDSYKYSHFAGSNAESVTVRTQTAIGARGAARASSGDEWTDIKQFAVEKGSFPETLSSIQNRGNTRFGSVKLYTMLPFDGDSNNSTGVIEFIGVQANGNPTIYYTEYTGTLPAYGGNLQNWDQSFLDSYNFTTTAPADMNTVTAVFIDFGNAVIEPNSSFDTIMKFEVPDQDNQTAYTQFQYSYQEIGSTSAPVSPTSDVFMFSTESFAVVYESNLPSFLLEGIVAAENIPDNQSTMLDVDRKGTIVLDTNGGVKPSLPGYKFVGWKVQDGTKVYQPGSSVSYVDPDPQILTLEAQWEAVDSTIKLYKNISLDNDELINTMAAPFGSEVDFTSFNEPSRTGYKFKGWSDRRQSNTYLGAHEKVNFINEKWFYANWGAHTYTVEYHANGGTGTMNPQNRAYEDGKELLNNGFSRVGFEFLGWSKTAQSTSGYYSENEIVDLTSVDGDNIKLYAVWKANTYTVEYNSKGGSALTNSTKIYGTDLTLSIPTRTGYTFEGWSKDEAATTVHYKTTLNEDLKTEQDDKVILYAVWKANTYSVKYDVKGGVALANGTKIYNDNLTLPTAVKSGYEFKGWSKDAAATTVHYTSVLNEDLKTEQDDEVILYAVWKAKTYTVNYDVKGGVAVTSDTKIYGENLSLPSTTRVGYTFKGWSKDAAATTVHYETLLNEDLKTEQDAEATLYAVWKANTYTVEYDVKGGSAVADGTKIYGENLTLPTIVKEGYKFEGWAKTDGSIVADYTSLLTDDLKTEQDDKVTLYAVWTSKTYIVKYDLKGGNETITNDVKTYGVDLVIPATGITKTGYTFEGWSKDASANTVHFTNKLTEDLSSTQDEEVVLYAVWKAHTYTIVFDANSGEGTMASMSKVYGTEKALSENSFTKDGYTFLGWNTDEDALIATYTDAQMLKTDLSSTEGASVTLYAIWEANTYTVKFESNGGHGTMLDLNMEYDVEQELPSATFTRDGYEFAGWSTTSDGAVEFTDEQEVINLALSGDITLYAIWAANEYDIVIDAKDVEFHISDLNKAITAKTVDTEILKKSGAKGYKVNTDGTKEELPVFVYNSDALLSAKEGDSIDVTLSLLDPQTNTERTLNPKEEANAEIKVVVTKDKTDEKTETKNPKDPSTGIKSMNSMFLIFVITFASLVVTVLIKKKRNS